MDADLAEVLTACADGVLQPGMVRWRDDACVCVVMASGGYPGAYTKGKAIAGLDQAARLEGVAVFHAGTRRQGGQVVTAGGRVLGVTALGSDLTAAVRRAYAAVSVIRFEQSHYRTDIARRALLSR
jgi:phosphoribosylamine--glycine ligase